MNYSPLSATPRAKPSHLRRLMFATACVTALLPASSALAGPLHYVIYDLGTLGAGHSKAFSLNEAGQVTGYSNHPDGPDRHAFLYSGGPLVDLGTLGGTSSVGWGINNSGEVTGSSTVYRSDADAFVYTGGILTNIGTPLGNSVGYAINDAGQVAGFRTNGGSPDYHATLRTGGVYQDLPDLGGGISFARAINEAGAVTGWSGVVGTGYEHAFFYENSVTTDLGTLGGNNSEGWAINASNQVAGRSQLVPGTTQQHAFLGTAAGLTDLGTLGGANSAALGINDAGWVVGAAEFSNGAAEHAFVYADGTMYDLNDLVTNLNTAGFTYLDYAADINNRGWIVGMGVTAGGWGHAYLAVPTSAAVPESNSMLFWLPAFLLLSACKRATFRNQS